MPGRLFHDAQTSAEYVSHAVKTLATGNNAGISIISWSAGSLITQWTLTFYQATRAHVRRHVALGPSYRGSWAMVPMFYLGLYSDAVVQQLPWSAFMAALRRAGGLAAHVPTTSIGSSVDQMVQPSFLGDNGNQGWGLGRYRAYLRDAWRLDEGPQTSNVDLFKLCASKLVREGHTFPRIFLHEALLVRTYIPRSHLQALWLPAPETHVANGHVSGAGGAPSSARGKTCLLTSVVAKVGAREPRDNLRRAAG